MEMLNIIGIAGSLREKSYNKMLLNEAIRLAPEEMEISVYDISIFLCIIKIWTIASRMRLFY